MYKKILLGGTASPSAIDYVSFVFHNVVHPINGYSPVLFMHGMKETRAYSSSGFCKASRGTLPFPGALQSDNGRLTSNFLCVKKCVIEGANLVDTLVSYEQMQSLLIRYLKWVKRMMRNGQLTSVLEDTKRILRGLQVHFGSTGIPLLTAWQHLIHGLLQEVGVKGITQLPLEEIIRGENSQRFLAEIFLSTISVEDAIYYFRTVDVAHDHSVEAPVDDSSTTIVEDVSELRVLKPPVRVVLWDCVARNILYAAEPEEIKYSKNSVVLSFSAMGFCCGPDTLRSHIIGAARKNNPLIQDIPEVEILLMGRGAFLISQLLLVGDVVSYPWYLSDDLSRAKAVMLINRWRSSSVRRVEVGKFLEYIFPLHSVDPERFSTRRLSPSGSTVLENVSFEAARSLVQFQIPFLRIVDTDEEILTHFTKNFFYSRQLLSSRKSRSGAIRNALYEWIDGRQPSTDLKHHVLQLQPSSLHESFSVQEAFAIPLAYRNLIAEALEMPDPLAASSAAEKGEAGAILGKSLRDMLALTGLIETSLSFKRLAELPHFSSSSLSAFQEAARTCSEMNVDKLVDAFNIQSRKRSELFFALKSSTEKMHSAEHGVGALLNDLLITSPFPLKNGLILRITKGKTKQLGKRLYSCKTMVRRLEVLTEMLNNAYGDIIALESEKKKALVSMLWEWVDSEHKLWSTHSQLIRPFSRCRDALDDLTAELVEYLCYLSLGPLRTNLFLLWALFGSNTVEVVADVIRRRGDIPVIVRSIEKGNNV